MAGIQPSPQLAAVLESHRNDIRSAWVERLRGLSGSHYPQRAPEELASWTEGGVAQLIRSVRDGSLHPLEAHAEEVSRGRRELGFEINEVVEGLLLLKEATLPFILEAYAEDAAQTRRALLCIDACLRGMMARFTALFADAMRQAVRDEALQHERLVVLEERQKLAHELHDSVTQSLYGVTMYGEAAARLLTAGNSARAAHLLRELRDTALEALREMRLLVFELRPPVLKREGLIAALQARLAAVEGRAGLRTDFQATGVGALPQAVAEGLHGIAKEALNNVLKHAEASRISVRLRQTPARIDLEIADDGVGFDPSEVRDKGGLGLFGMEERARKLNARLALSSRPGDGTRVRVEVPWTEVSPANDGEGHEQE